nr:hypothetical protein [Tanacetum cinerariifolium]
PPSPYYVPGPEHPPFPDYVPGPEHPPSPIKIPYVPEPEYPKYLEPSDDEAPLEDQPLPADASPIAASPDYVADSNPEEDLEDDQADSPTDRGDAEHKRKFDDTSRNTQHQQQPPKRNNVARAYTAVQGDKKPYGGTKPLYPNCNYHHNGPCTQKCTNCRKIGHWACDCKGRPTATNNNNNNNNQRAQGENARGITYFECGFQGYYKNDCPRLKFGNQGNQAGHGNTVARAYAVGTAGTNPNSNVVT